MDRGKWGIAKLWDFVDFLMFSSMVVMIIFVFTNTALRYLFNSSLRVSAELSSFLFVWVIMLGAAIALKEDKHLDVRLVDGLISPAFLKILRGFIQLAILACSLIIAVGCYKQAVIDWYNIAPLTGIPRGVVYIAGTVSGSLMAATAFYFMLAYKNSAGEN